MDTTHDGRLWLRDAQRDGTHGPRHIGQVLQEWALRHARDLALPSPEKSAIGGSGNVAEDTSCLVVLG